MIELSVRGKKGLFGVGLRKECVREYAREGWSLSFEPLIDAFVPRS